MTIAAVGGADHHMNIVAVMLKGIGMGAGTDHVALRTADSRVFKILGHIFAWYFTRQPIYGQGIFRGSFRMAAIFPVADDAGMNRCMTVNTFGSCLADRYICTRYNCVLQKNNP